MNEIGIEAKRIAERRNMTLEELHIWIRRELKDEKCCKDGRCVGKELKLDSLTFRVRGHCCRLELHATYNTHDYELVNVIHDR